MKIALVLGLCYFHFIQIDTKKYRVILDDTIIPYDDSKIAPHFSKIISIENLNVEQIDDYNVLASGYIEWIESMDRSLPIRLNLRTKYFEHGIWREAPVKLVLFDICSDYLNPQRFWYNITKLWSSDLCPPRKGDKWLIETQNVSGVYDLPPSTPMVPWRAYFTNSQGIIGFEKVKLGFGVQGELEPI